MASAGGGALSILEYLGGEDGNRCGYCKSESGNISHGMWAHSLTVQDYQDLIDRGWRRSGKYVYKPLMSQTCCPQYTIRLAALHFEPTKSHKKVLKKMRKFLETGKASHSTSDGSVGEPMDSQADSPISCNFSMREKSEISEDELKPLNNELEETEKEQDEKQIQLQVDSSPADRKAEGLQSANVEAFNHSVPKPGKGADANKPPCRKAKDIRKERRLQKLLLQQSETSGVLQDNSVNLNAKPKANCGKSLEEFISVTQSDATAHNLEVRLVRSSPPSSQFKASFQESYQVYKRYQMTIHQDPPDKPSISQVRRDLPNWVLISTAFQYWQIHNSKYI